MTFDSSISFDSVKTPVLPTVRSAPAVAENQKALKQTARLQAAEAKGLITVKVAAVLLGTSEATVYNRFESGQLTRVKEGHFTYIAKAQVEALIALQARIQKATETGLNVDGTSALAEAVKNLGCPPGCYRLAQRLLSQKTKKQKAKKVEEAPAAPTPPKPLTMAEVNGLLPADIHIMGLRNTPEGLKVFAPGLTYFVDLNRNVTVTPR